MGNYKNYKVWEKSHQLVLRVYSLTKVFPKSEQYNLTSQMNKASVSIPTNIAEGCGRETQKEFIRFYISFQVLLTNWIILCYWLPTWVILNRKYQKTLFQK